MGICRYKATVFAWYLHNLSPFIWEFRDGIGLRWYGFAYVLAFVCGYQLYLWLTRHGYSELKPERVSDFITWAALFGVLLGGRIGHALFYDFRETLADPLRVFRVWEGGMSSHGGMLGLILFTFFYARKHGVSWTGIGDNLCVVAPVGLFFGRIANFINGELYGRISSVPWAVQFPKELYDSPDLADRAVANLGGNFDAAAIIEQAHHDSHVAGVLKGVLPPRHPSQLYEAFLEGVVLFAILWLVRTRTRQPRGVLTGLFFICYAVLRIAGEVFRVPDPAWAFGVFSAGQFLSLFLIVIGVAFIVWAKRHPHYEKADETDR